METCFRPFRLLSVDGIEELKVESILFGIACSLE